MPSFAKLYQSLNPSQKQAVDAIEGPVMVIAGPGTGKTQVLTLRIANILRSTQSQPENILALTFTETGVAAMRERLATIIGPTAYNVQIFTFHSFAHYIINTHPDIFPTMTTAQLTTEVDQIQILESIFASTPLKHTKPIGEPTLYLKAALSGITELKKEGITPAAFKQALDQQKQDVESTDDLYHDKGAHRGKLKGKYKQAFKDLDKNFELQKIYTLYQKHLKKLSLYDFDDLLINLIDQLKQNDDFRLSLQEHFHYFLLDEHQDTNLAQNQIVAILASFHQSPNVFSVGDEKQAIFRFQGASLANFLRLKSLYPNTQIINLETNYRSTQSLLDSAQNLINHLPVPDLDLPLRQALSAASTSTGSSPELVELPHDHAQHHFIAQSIKHKLDSGTNPSEIAIIAKENQDLYYAMTALATHNIPFMLQAKQNILEDLHINKFINLLKAATTLEDQWLLPALHFDFFDLHPTDLFLLRRHSLDHKQPLVTTLSNLDKLDLPLIRPDALKQTIDQIFSWHQLVGNQTLDHVFTTILNHSGLLASVLNHPQLTDALNKFVVLYDQVRTLLSTNPHATLTDFITHLDLLTKHNLKLTTSSSSLSTSAVRLMTAHGSKGLEFDHVYITDLRVGKWGDKRNFGASFKLPYDYLGLTISGFTDDPNADDRRLLYVALTRARHSVTLTHTQTKIDGKANTLSRFISEIGDTHLTRADTTSFESEFAHRLETIFTPTPTTKSLDLDSLQTTVTDLFARQGLSPTALNNYLKCPWIYFFRSLLKLPEAQTLPLVFGNAIHHTLNRYLLSLPKKPLSQKQVITTFTDYLSNQHLTEVERQELQFKGESILPPYFQQVMTTWSPDHQTELNITGVGLEPNIRLTGKIDMLAPAGKPNHFHVVDFKTGKPKSKNAILGNTQTERGDYHRQLIFYKLLLDRHLSGRFVMEFGVISFIQPNDSGKLKSESFIITKSDSDSLTDQIRVVADEIRNLKFWDTRCEDPDCQYCRLRAMMG